MKKTVVSFGRRRQTDHNDEKNRSGFGGLCTGLFVLGVVTICASIIIPMSVPRIVDTDDAVAVISDNVVSEREILVANDIPADTNEEFSIFEYIGEAIAYLLTGVK